MSVLRRQVLGSHGRGAARRARRRAAMRSAPSSRRTPSCVAYAALPAPPATVSGTARERRPTRARRTLTQSPRSGTTSTPSGWPPSSSTSGRTAGPALRRPPHRRPSRRLRPRLGPRFVRRAACTGARPPTTFFAGGQDWAFPPAPPRADAGRRVPLLHRRASGAPSRHAAYLRVDHVMGLQRLYWIPEGFDARHGAYVSYRADELHAVVALEAAPGRGGRGRRGPGHGARRGAAAGWPRTACCARGSSSSNRRPTDPLPPDPPERPGVVGHPRPAPLPAYFSGRRHRRDGSAMAGSRRPRRRRNVAGGTAGARAAARAPSRRCSGPRCRRRGRRAQRPARWRCAAACSIWPSGAGRPRPGRPRGPVGRARAAEPARHRDRRRQLAAPGPRTLCRGARDDRHDRVPAHRQPGPCGGAGRCTARSRGGACDERRPTAGHRGDRSRRVPALRGRPLLVQRGHPPPHWATSSARTSAARRRGHVRGVGAQRHARWRSSATSTTGTPTRTCSRRGAARVSGKGTVAEPPVTATSTSSPSRRRPASASRRPTRSPLVRRDARRGPARCVWDLPTSGTTTTGCGRRGDRIALAAPISVYEVHLGQLAPRSRTTRGGSSATPRWPSR